MAQAAPPHTSSSVRRGRRAALTLLAGIALLVGGPVTAALADPATQQSSTAPSSTAQSGTTQSNTTRSGTTTSTTIPAGQPGGVQQIRPLTPAGSAARSSPVKGIDGTTGTTAKGTTSGTPAIQLDLKGSGGMSNPLTVVLLLGLVSIIPALLIMVTAFTRIVIVLGFTRSALNTNGIPPNQVIVGLALFLTLFVMAPTFSKINHDALQPYLHGTMSQSQAYTKGMEPLRGFMLRQVRDKDLALFVKMSGTKPPADRKQVPTTTLIPAYVLSELRAAFLIGFVIFIPFIVIDFVVSAALSSMGMMMLPPALISLPFKLLLFVAADGWYLVVQSLVRSFH